MSKIRPEPLSVSRPSSSAWGRCGSEVTVSDLCVSEAPYVLCLPDSEAECRTALSDWLLKYGEQIYYDRLSRALQHVGRTDIAIGERQNGGRSFAPAPRSSKPSSRAALLMERVPN